MRREEGYVQKHARGGCVSEAKVRKTETFVDGQHQARIDREGIIRRRGIITNRTETTSSGKMF